MNDLRSGNSAATPSISQVEATTLSRPFEIRGASFGRAGGTIRFLILEPAGRSLAFKVLRWTPDRVVLKSRNRVHGRVIGMLQLQSASGELSNTVQLVFPGAVHLQP